MLDFLVPATYENIASQLRMHKGIIVETDETWLVVQFPNARYATSFYTVNNDWRIDLVAPITSLNEPVWLKVFLNT